MLLLLRSLPLLACAIVFASAWWVIRISARVPRRAAALEALFAGYLGGLVYVVFVLPVRVSPEASSVWSAVNLIPLHTIVGIVREHPGMVTWQLLGNVVLFMPLGAMLPMLGRRFRRFGAMVLVGLSVSVGIELVQLAMLLTATAHRSVDIDDVILNVAGAGIGYLAWRGAHSLGRHDGAQQGSRPPQ